MTNMTAEERAAKELPCDCGNITEFHSPSCQSRFQPALVEIIHQAEADARQELLNELWQRVSRIGSTSFTKQQIHDMMENTNVL